MSRRVLAVLNGRDEARESILAWARSADDLYAADGAATFLIEAGLNPTVVGDLDSFRGNPSGHRVVELPDQSSSDADKLLSVVTLDRHRSVCLAGLEGDRLDHVLGSLSSAVRCNLALTLVLRRGMGFLIRSGDVRSFDLAPGQRFSLMPLVPCIGVDLNGCEWPLEGEDLALNGFTSLSNRAQGTVGVSIQGGSALMIVERPKGSPPDWEMGR